MFTTNNQNTKQVQLRIFSTADDPPDEDNTLMVQRPMCPMSHNENRSP